MNAPTEEWTRRLQAARTARQRVQRMRMLAAKRAEALELALAGNAQKGLQAEISRGMAARTRLAGKRPGALSRYAAVAALGLLLGVATSGAAWVAVQGAAAIAPTPLLDAGPGDGLRLAMSYGISLKDAINPPVRQ